MGGRKASKGGCGVNDGMPSTGNIPTSGPKIHLGRLHRELRGADSMKH